MPTKCLKCEKCALYNKVGEINPKFCVMHKEEKMINIFNSFRFPKNYFNCSNSFTK